MNRTTKQAVYGSGYVIILFFVVYGMYGAVVKPAPTCTDNTQNRDEVEVDCGGRFCQSCEIKRLMPIQVSEVKVFQTPDTKHSTVFFEIRNPNSAYGTQLFNYQISLFGASGTKPLYEEFGKAVVYPSETKTRLLVNLPVAPEAISLSVATNTLPYTWRSISELVRPRTLTRDVQQVYVDGQGVITGVVRNDNAFLVNRVIVNVLVSDSSGRLVGASKTIMQDLIAAEERSFKITVALPSGMSTDGLTSRLQVEAER